MTPFENFKNLLLSLEELKESNQAKVLAVFFDSIDTLRACYPYFKGLQNLSINKVILVVDDSHGIGILGENGRRAYKIIKKMKPKELVVCCSLGKGFGIQAGAIFGTKALIGQLTNTDFFGGQSPAVPAALATLSESQLIFE